MTATTNVRAVIAFLGLIGLACVIGVVVLAMADKSTPDVLSTAAGASIGGLAALLASTRSQAADVAGAPVVAGPAGAGLPVAP